MEPTFLGIFVQFYSSYRLSFRCQFYITRPKPAFGRQGLDWIVGPEYSFRVFSTWKMKNQPGTMKTLKTMKTDLEQWKTNLAPWKPQKKTGTIKTINTNLKTWKTNLDPWKILKTHLDPWKTNSEPCKTIKTHGEPWKPMKNQPYPNRPPLIQKASLTRDPNRLPLIQNASLTRGPNRPFKCLDSF